MDADSNILSENQKEKVRIFLENCKLGQYFSNFLEQGYDDLEQIVEFSKNVQEMDSFLKDVGLHTKPGHKRRFVAAIQIEASKLDHGLGTSKDACGEQGPPMKKACADHSKCTVCISKLI